MSQSNSPPKMMLQLHQRYKRTLEISIILTLLTVSTLFYSFKSFELNNSLYWALGISLLFSEATFGSSVWIFPLRIIYPSPSNSSQV